MRLSSHLFAVLLAATISGVGCSSPPVNNGDGDNGGTDGGTPADGGNPQQTTGQVGDDCVPATEAKPQGEGCDSAYECQNIEGTAMCTGVCTNANACGTNGSIPNVCVQATETESICLRGCDPAKAGSCNRQGMVCFQSTVGDFCLGDCNARAEPKCSEGYQCASSGLCRPVGSTPSYGDCTSEPCTGDGLCVGVSDTMAFCFPDCTNTTCPAGDKCAIPLQNEGKVCARDCSAGQACPTGFACKTIQGNKICFPSGPAGTRNPYETCDDQNGCVDGSACIGFSATANMCLADCTSDANSCPTGQACVVPTQDGSKFCAKTCTTAQPACPTGTTCKPVSASARACIP